MPRKKEETANADAVSKSAKNSETTSSTSEETTKKPTRKRRTADEILKEKEAAAKSDAAPEKEKKAPTKKPAAKTTAAKKATTAKADKPAPEAKKAEPAPQPEVSKRLFGRKTLADEVEEEKKDPSKKTARKPAVKKEEPEAKPAAKKAEPKKAEPVKAEPKRAEPKPTKSKPAAKSKTAAKSTGDVYSRSVEVSWRASEARVSEEPEAPVDNKPEPVFRTRKSEGKPLRAKETKTEPEVLPDPIDLGDEQGRMKILMWRSSGDTKSESQDNDRRPSRRGRRDETEAPVTAADAYGDEIKPRFRVREPEPEEVKEPEAPAAPPEPEVVVREPIARREEAAQVVFHEGHPKIIKNKVAYAPFVFFVGTPEGRNESQVVDEIKLAAEHGVHMFMVAYDFVTDPDLTRDHIVALEGQIERIVNAAPEAQVILRLNFSAPDNWEKTYPQAKAASAKGKHAVPSISDDAYWQVADDTMADVVKALSNGKHASAIMGVHLDRNRWEFDPVNNHDDSEAAEERFRKWLKLRYRNDIVTLRAAWFDGKVTFENVQIPEAGFTDTVGEFVRTDRKARRWIDYHLFLSDITVERIGELCYAAKAASDGEFLVGVTYGSTFESSHPASGQLSLGKLLRCPELDYISGAPWYEDIAPGSSAGFPVPVDSFALNGKIFLQEEDYRTPISGTGGDDNLPLIKTPQALEAVHWRGAGSALAHDGGLIWCDDKAKGWLNSRGIWERAGQVREALLKNLVSTNAEPEVAVFIDERSLTYLTDERSFEVLIQDVRESALRSGLSVGFYLLSDLAHRESFPEAKLYAFLNAWDIRPEVRSAIKSRLQCKGKVLFWLYTAGLFEAGRESLERVREVTGIALRPQPFNSKAGTTVLNTTEPLGQAIPQDKLSKGGELTPSFFAIPEDGNIIAEYSSTGLPSLLVKPFVGDTPDQNWTSVFLGEPMVTPAFFRALGELAGCHVWNFDNDVVHAAAPNLTIHCSETGPRTITLPSKWVAYNVATEEYMPVENNTVKFKALDGSTYTFVVGTIGDVQKIVKADLDTVRKITSPVVRDENTLHWDTVRFDVEIMKLDEWVEETWSEDLADDFMLKPSLLDIDSEALMESPEERPTNETGRRRRPRRRGRRGDRPNDRRSHADTIEEEIGVLFRKRD